MIVSSSPPGRSRLTVLVTHPIQYNAPVYRSLAQRDLIDLRVVYLTDAGAVTHDDPGFALSVQWDVPLLDGYDYTVLQPGTDVTSRRFWQRHDPGLISVLEGTRPDYLLVYGYDSRMNWAAVRWARQHSVRVLYTSDSNSRNDERLVPFKRLAIGHFFRYVDVFLATSEYNFEYLTKYGALHDQIHRIPFAIEVSRFSPAVSVRGLPREYDFVWAGKLTARKRCSDFIAALSVLVRSSGTRIRACIVGDGPEKESLQLQALQLPAHCTLDFLGFLNQSDMPGALRASETLVFTSEQEPYGIIATEAAAAGLSLIVAEGIGCIGDTVLARPGVNALIYPPGDVELLAKAMMEVHVRKELLRNMQQASVNIAREHDLLIAVTTIERIVQRRCGDTDVSTHTNPVAPAHRTVRL